MPASSTGRVRRTFLSVDGRVQSFFSSSRRPLRGRSAALAHPVRQGLHGPDLVSDGQAGGARPDGHPPAPADRGGPNPTGRDSSRAAPQPPQTINPSKGNENGATARYTRRSRSVFPAHAGVFLRWSSSVRTCGGLPRTRGGVPPLRGWRVLYPGSSPHTRGCSRPGQHRPGAVRVFPAHAGVFPTTSSARCSARRLPRTRGGVPNPTAQVRQVGKSSPHTRGCSQRRTLDQAGSQVFPAHAGVFLDGVQAMKGAARLPRARGGVPFVGPVARAFNVSSLHTRGCSPDGPEPLVQGEVFPAHAGVFPTPCDRATAASRLPRTRGGVPGRATLARESTRSSPHSGDALNGVLL